MADKSTKKLAKVVMAWFFAVLLTWMPYWSQTATAATIAEIDFTADWQENVSGELLPGGSFTVKYDSERLTCARDEKYGQVAWNILGYVQFAQDGEYSYLPLETPGEDEILSQEYDIPCDAEEVIMWFFNNGYYNPQGCYDSNYDANYHFALN